MEEKKMNKWLRHQFSVTGWVTLLYTVLMNTMIAVVMMADMVGQYLKGFASGNFFPEMDMDALMNNAWGYILAILMGIVILWAWKGTDYWKDEVFKKEAPMKASAFFALVAMVGGAQLIFTIWFNVVETIMNQFGRSIMDIVEPVTGSGGSVSMVLYMSLLGPIAEEILFRGLVLRSLRPYGKRFAILGSAFLFAMFHGHIIQIPYAFVVGLVLGYTAAEYSIYWAIGLHIFNNFVLADLMARLASLLPDMAGEILDGLVVIGFTIAAVGILIAKRKEIKTYCQEQWMDRRCVKSFFFNPGVVVFTVVMAAIMIFMLAA